MSSIPVLQLATIQGSLKINCCPNLITIGGFNLLTSVRSIDIYYNANLTSITALASITHLQGYLRVVQNPKLVSITGLFANIGSYLEIDRNPSLNEVNFNQLTAIGGADTVAGHALSIGYTALQSLSGFRALSSISYGTVRIEGNTALCYAGYPQWGELGQFASRDSSSGADKGLDWRQLLSASNQWQYTWGVEGGGIPTLLIRDNAPAGTCGEWVGVQFFNSLFTPVIVQPYKRTKYCIAVIIISRVYTFLRKEVLQNECTIKFVSKCLRYMLNQQHLIYLLYSKPFAVIPLLGPILYVSSPIASASCSSFCEANAGCLGPVGVASCGSCATLAGGVNPCDIIPSTPSPVDITTIIVAVVASIVGIALLVLLPLGIWGCVVVGRRYKELRQGSFDISVSDP